MDDDYARRSMIMAGICIALMIVMALWQVLRTLSRGGLDARGLLKLTANLVLLGIMLYVGYTALSLWT
jgi:hypothetical protein